MKDLLAYMHPVVQVLVLLIAVATLRLGLALKNHRTGPTVSLTALFLWHAGSPALRGRGLCGLALEAGDRALCRRA